MLCFKCISGIEEKLVFSTNGYLKELNLDTMVLTVIANSTGIIYSLAYDYKDSYMYALRYHLSDIVRYCNFIFNMFKIILKNTHVY